MKAIEKENIYKMLKSASSWAQGFIPPEFSGPDPDFEDDFEEIIEKPLIQNQAAPDSQAEAQAVTQVSPAAETGAAKDTEAEKESADQKIFTLNTKIRSCTNCMLSRTSALPFPGKGVLNPAVLVIGEAPMEDKGKNLSSFAEETEVLLNKMLSAINLSTESNCFVTTSVKCLPPQNRSPMKDEQDSCSGFLQAQICYLKPSLILVMGRTSAQHILKSDEIINKLRGKFFDYKGIPLMATFSPQQVLQDAGLKRPVWEDLKMVRARLLEINDGYDIPFRKRILAEK
ncbi:uracil-DNA glycosylase [Treponema sp.]|uniref:uracil-DNA glycosylase n=1 Tax=Treponema sp. TaxID=166 RepID=UPI0025E1054E|nr:uracil-DNA glycosylase [Treponema sp.]MCR5218118.1 uracil-DNA glycosylase [Treponema sp.]